MPNHISRVLGVIALGLADLSSTSKAQAQTAVIDLNAIAKAEQQISQGLTEIRQLQQALSNQTLMLQKTQTNTAGPVAAVSAGTVSILQQAQGLGYGAQSIAQAYAALYPASMPGASLAATQAALAQWRQNNALALQQAMQLQNQVVQNQPSLAAQVASAVAASQAAPGPTAAIQTTNQLLAAVAAELAQLQAILISEGRAGQVLSAATQSAQAVGGADSQRFWATPQPSSRVQNPGQL